MTSSHILNSPSDEEIETSHADSDFTTVKVNKFQRKVRSDQLVIESYNLFEKFNDQEFQVQVAEDHDVLGKKGDFSFEEHNSEVEETVTEDEEFRIVRVNRSKRKVRYHSKIPISYSLVGLDKFETPNRFDILKNNSEEDVRKIIKRLNIMKMKKALLNKCRHCNFKKRSCMLDRSSCSAKEKTCLACLKGGHFPRSLNCKRTRKARKSRVQSKTITDQVRKPPKKISSEVHKLINEKIVELETVINSYSNCKRLSKQTSNIPCEVIPFAMMFIFLNYGCIFSVDSYENVRSLLEYEKKSTELRKSILKEANYCARKFSEINFQEDKEHFSTYCSKRLRKTLGIRSISNKMRLL